MPGTINGTNTMLIKTKYNTLLPGDDTAIDQIIAPLERSSVRPSIPWVGEKN